MATKNVLVIEDNADSRHMYKNALEMENYRVTTAADGPSAFAELEKKELPDLIMLDLSLPGMSGPAILNAIRKAPNLKNLKVLVVSGWENIASLAAEAGADGYLKKPFNLDCLYQSVSDHISLRPQSV